MANNATLPAYGDRMKQSKVNIVMCEVETELKSAVSKFGPFNNSHEGYAVLLEEVDELWNEVKTNQSSPLRNIKIRKEAIQVAAMAIRLIVDVCDEGKS